MGKIDPCCKNGTNVMETTYCVLIGSKATSNKWKYMSGTMNLAKYSQLGNPWATQVNLLLLLCQLNIELNLSLNFSLYTPFWHITVLGFPRQTCSFPCHTNILDSMFSKNLGTIKKIKYVNLSIWTWLNLLNMNISIHLLTNGITLLFVISDNFPLCVYIHIAHFPCPSIYWWMPRLVP